MKNTKATVKEITCQIKACKGNKAKACFELLIGPNAAFSIDASEIIPEKCFALSANRMIKAGILNPSATISYIRKRMTVHTVSGKNCPIYTLDVK